MKEAFYHRLWSSVGHVESSLCWSPADVTVMSLFGGMKEWEERKAKYEEQSGELLGH
jgi:hypothetical protein